MASQAPNPPGPSPSAHSCSLAVLFGIPLMSCRAILSATAIIFEMTTGLSLTYGTGTAFVGGGFFHMLWW